MAETLLSAKWIIPVTKPPFQDGAVVVQKDRILAVGKKTLLEKKYPKALKKDFPQSVLLPGFVNTHAHSVYTVLHDRVTAESYSSWLKQMVAQVKEEPLSKKERLDSSLAGLKEMLRSGVTTVADSGPYAEALQAMRTLKIRGLFYKEIFGFLPKKKREVLKASQRTAQIQTGLSLHSPYTNPPQLLKQLSQECFKKKIPLTLHVAEAPEEQLFFKEGRGGFVQIFPGRENLIPRARTSVAYLEKLKLLHPDLLAVHCVQVDTKDIQMLAKKKVKIAYCPSSNAYLKVGLAPVKKMLRKNIVVGLGTDGASSAPSLDFFSLMRDAVSLGSLSPKQVLEMATLGGAKALGLSQEIGSLEPNKKADMIAISLQGLQHLPYHDDLYASVVWGGLPQDVSFVMVNGKTL